MQAIEFDSYIENGVISIPPRYQNAVKSLVRVIILPKEEPSDIAQNSVKKEGLYSLNIDMADFTFNRDEVNER